MEDYQKFLNRIKGLPLCERKKCVEEYNKAAKKYFRGSVHISIINKVSYAILFVILGLIVFWEPIKAIL